MALPDKAALLTMAYGAGGLPFVQVAAKETIDTSKLEYGEQGLPFVGVGGGSAPPEPPARKLRVLMVIT